MPPEERVVVTKIEASGRAHYLHVRPHGYPLVIHYAAGRYAQELTKAGPGAAQAAARGAVAAAFGTDALKELVGGGAATNWGSDSRFLGAYACAKPGEYPARLALSEPFSDRIWLAGEALAGERSQTLDGAWRSGARAATAILKSLKR
jgi:monoamine oxidase